MPEGGFWEPPHHAPCAGLWVIGLYHVREFKRIVISPRDVQLSPKDGQAAPNVHLWVKGMSEWRSEERVGQGPTWGTTGDKASLSAPHGVALALPESSRGQLLSHTLPRRTGLPRGSWAFPMVMRVPAAAPGLPVCRWCRAALPRFSLRISAVALWAGQCSSPHVTDGKTEACMVDSGRAGL